MINKLLLTIIGVALGSGHVQQCLRCYRNTAMSKALARLPRHSLSGRLISVLIRFSRDMGSWRSCGRCLFTHQRLSTTPTYTSCRRYRPLLSLVHFPDNALIVSLGHRLAAQSLINLAAPIHRWKAVHTASTSLVCVGSLDYQKPLGLLRRWSIGSMGQDTSCSLRLTDDGTKVRRRLPMCGLSLIRGRNLEEHCLLARSCPESDPMRQTRFG